MDKVVRVWDLTDEPRLARTLRPMSWRGPAGIIYAMALSPRPDESGQRLLAVAGYGVDANRADFTIFRVPGIEPTGTGEIVARVFPPQAGDPRQPSHRNAILCLAIDPTGKVLASGSIDRTVILWDIVPGPQTIVRPRVALTDHTREIRALAFSPDGKKLATTGRRRLAPALGCCFGAQARRTAGTSSVSRSHEHAGIQPGWTVDCRGPGDWHRPGRKDLPVRCGEPLSSRARRATHVGRARAGGVPGLSSRRPASCRQHQER